MFPGSGQMYLFLVHRAVHRQSNNYYCTRNTRKAQKFVPKAKKKRSSVFQIRRFATEIN
jgi:hypothetical protein